MLLPAKLEAEQNSLLASFHCAILATRAEAARFFHWWEVAPVGSAVGCFPGPGRCLLLPNCSRHSICQNPDICLRNSPSKKTQRRCQQTATVKDAMLEWVGAVAPCPPRHGPQWPCSLPQFSPSPLSSFPAHYLTPSELIAAGQAREAATLSTLFMAVDGQHEILYHLNAHWLLELMFDQCGLWIGLGSNCFCPLVCAWVFLISYCESLAYLKQVYLFFLFR